MADGAAVKHTLPMGVIISCVIIVGAQSLFLSLNFEDSKSNAISSTSIILDSCDGIIHSVGPVEPSQPRL
ncbi:hypothetical protein ElyMa_002019600, partial [Elysia marginata]